MSVNEILHRVSENWLRNSGRNTVPVTFSLFDCVLGKLEFEEASFKFLADQACEEWQQSVQLARAGNWCFLGRHWPRTALQDLWHLDPVSKSKWPAAFYCFDINYRHNLDMGDIKYVWEANRLQILPIAAALWRARKRDEDRDFTIEIINSWIDSNPPFKGVNWISGIELALRSINILAAVSLLGPETLEQREKERIFSSLQAHLFWLNRFPSKFSSANNHLIAELAASYVLCRCVPNLKDAQEVAQRSWEGLTAEVLNQIYPDGIGVEQSPTYTCFTIEWVLFAISVARTAGDIVPEKVLDRLCRAGECLGWMMDAGGQVPRIGDDDEGRVIIGSTTREVDYPALVLSSMAATLGRSDLAPPKDRVHLRQLWIGRSSQPWAAPNGVKSFDNGGYTVFRHNVGHKKSMIVLDHGPLGYLSIAAHGHADALSIWWHVADNPIFVDAGTYLYHSGGAERDKFRGTCVHNTLLLDAKNQSQISGAFNWAHKAKAWRLPLNEELGKWVVEGVHDGYTSSGVLHHRRVELTSPNTLLISDWLEGRLKRRNSKVTIAFLLHPDVKVQKRGFDVILSYGDQKLCAISAFRSNSKPSRATVRNGLAIRKNLLLSDAETSPHFNHKCKTNRIYISLPAKLLIESKLFINVNIFE